jgi:hypothetical protein
MCVCYRLENDKKNDMEIGGFPVCPKQVIKKK